MTPSELMFGRLIKSKVDLVKPDLNTQVENKQFQQKSQHDQHSHDRKFLVGEGIMYTEILVEMKIQNGNQEK